MSEQVSGNFGELIPDQVIRNQSLIKNFGEIEKNQKIEQSEKTEDAEKICRNPNHPKKGSALKVDPIKNEKDIKAIKKLLANTPRDLAIFCLGINTALRAGDLLKIKVADVRGLKEGDIFELKEQKTGKYRDVTLNKVSHKAVMSYLATRDDPEDDDWLFESRKRASKSNGRLTVGSLNTLVKSWCEQINLSGKYGTHSLRKTFGYHQRVRFGMGTALLMQIYNHKSEWQTLNYLGIKKKELHEIQLNSI